MFQPTHSKIRYLWSMATKLARQALSQDIAQTLGDLFARACVHYMAWQALVVRFLYGDFFSISYCLIYFYSLGRRKVKNYMIPPQSSNPSESANYSECFRQVSTQSAHLAEQQVNAALTAPYRSQSKLFYSEKGRAALYTDWLQQQITEGKIDPAMRYTLEERTMFMKNWLRSLIAEEKLDPRKRLPPYAALESLPFQLREKEISRVIAELRNEGLLPPRKPRIDKGQPQWTDRDRYCMNWIGHMRAIRLDQAQRLLARHSEYQTSDPERLSVSRASQIIQRWVCAKYAVYRRVYVGQPGWIHLTRKGLYHAGLNYRAEPPKDRMLDHLYHINEVRLRLEEENPSLKWISERAIQAEQEKRQRGQLLEHIPDGIIVNGSELIDIEVQIARPSQHKVELVMRGGIRGNSMNPLRYYASEDAIAVVRRAYQAVMKGGRQSRPRIEVIELEGFLKSVVSPAQ